MCTLKLISKVSSFLQKSNPCTFDHKISSDLPPAQNAKPGEKKVEFPNTHCTIVAQNDGGKIHRHFQAMNENSFAMPANHAKSKTILK